MIKNLEHITETKKRLTVEIPANDIEKRIQDSLRDIGRRTRLPGFRPGKAPLSLLEKRFGSDVEGDVLQKIVPEYYVKALKEANLSPVSDPEIEKSDFKRKSPFEMIFAVEVLPEIKDLTYEGLKIKDEDVEVTDEEMETSLKRIQAERMSYETVERTVENDDMVTLDYEVVEEKKEEKGQIFKVGSDAFPKEFSDTLIGKKAGDVFDVTMSFPEDHQSDFKGKTLTFKGTVSEVKILKLPDIDEKLATDIGFQSLATLKDSLKADILAAKNEQVRKKQIVDILEELVKMHDFPVPEAMYNAEIQSLLTSVKAKEENKDKDDETLRKDLKPEAEKNVKVAVLLDVIGKKENITVTEEEMKEKILELSQRTGIPPQNLVQMYMSKDGSIEGLRYGIYKEKVAELIHEKATVEKGE